MGHSTGAVGWLGPRLLLLLVLPLRGLAEDAVPEPLVFVRPGTMPVIVSAPHGGQAVIPEVPVRQGKGVRQFVTARDGGTSELAERIADKLETTLHRRPYLVVARFHRRFLDVNRPAADAYEAEQAKAVYDAYHVALKHACRDVQQQWGHGLLIDVHGQGADAQAIFRGTSNGQSVTLLCDRYGEQALIGPESLFGRLDQQGYKVVPAVGSRDREDRRYNGGYIVRTYGSHQGTGIDAIQLEFGGTLRSTARRDKTATDAVAAIAAYVKDYLPVKRAGATIK